jgi:hypothetical protein
MICMQEKLLANLGYDELLKPGEVFLLRNGAAVMFSLQFSSRLQLQ